MAGAVGLDAGGGRQRRGDPLAVGAAVDRLVAAGRRRGGAGPPEGRGRAAHLAERRGAGAARRRGGERALSDGERDSYVALLEQLTGLEFEKPDPRVSVRARIRDALAKELPEYF